MNIFLDKYNTFVTFPEEENPLGLEISWLQGFSGQNEKQQSAKYKLYNLML